MRALDRKALRDSWNMRWQFIAIGLVIGCGIAMLIMSWSMLVSLQLTQSRYYEMYRFGDVFAHLKRAPQSVANQIVKIPGVQDVQTRIVGEVILDVPGLAEPASGRLISIPEPSESNLNRLHLRQGRMPEAGQAGEVVVSESFAKAHRLAPGRPIYAVLNGRRELLTIVGIALSPEYVYQVRGGEVLPNERTFGVFWMSKDNLAAAFDLTGAFNDVCLALAPGALEEEIIDHLDHLLARYGGLGAYGRDIQASNRYITNELRELRNMGYFAPMIFLVVAAFLLNVVLSRTIATQQVQIATLKAFGYTRQEIAWHYFKLTATVLLLGLVLGIFAGWRLGIALTQMYSQFFHFPVLEFQLHTGVLGWAVLVTLASGLAAVLVAVWRAVRLPPAAAMQPEPPTHYRPATLERCGLARFLSPVSRMIFRHLERRPIHTLFTMVGLAASVGVIVLGNHATDAVDELIDFHFWVVQRSNVSVGFVEPTSADSLHDLARLPGVFAVEPVRSVAAQIRFRGRSRRQDILGLVSQPKLYRLIDVQRREQALPSHGLLISAKLAELLDVQPGDEVEVSILEGRRPVARLCVQNVIDDMIGTSAYMDIDALRRLLREGGTVSGAFISVREDRLSEFYRRLKETPRVATVTGKLAALDSIRATLASTLLTMRTINLIFATIIAGGVVYNSARIAVAERSRDLASLRVLGYTRNEISFVLLGELALVTLVAVPVGLILGYALVTIASWGYDTELFRIPVVVFRRTYAIAVVTVLAAAAAAAWTVRRRLDRLDLIAVLKTRE